ncbi:MAG: 4'-phosphopantetheinyl transferase superfamily protein [Tepidisphaeraceae bacterium]|jgi:phosphopantetheine--protein transferase-like protein
MEKALLLRQTVADLMKIDAPKLTASAPLSGGRLSGSIGRAALDAAIRRRLQVECPAVYTVTTFGELETALFGTNGNDKVNGDSHSHATENVAKSLESADTVSAAKPVAKSANGDASSTASCGVDIELVENIPATADPWEDEFHRQTFSPAEIAYCLMQENPRMHLAARWCAKEALRKCDPAFANAKSNTIELWSDGASMPMMRHLQDGVAQVLPHAVSIAHTASSAVAMVVSVRDGAIHQPLSVVPVAAQNVNGHSGVSWPVRFALAAALAASIWALLRTFIKA